MQLVLKLPILLSTLYKLPSSASSSIISVEHCCDSTLSDLYLLHFHVVSFFSTSALLSCNAMPHKALKRQSLPYGLIFCWYSCSQWCPFCIPSLKQCYHMKQLKVCSVLQPTSMGNAAWLYNQLSNHITGLIQLEMIIQTKGNHQDLLRACLGLSWLCLWQLSRYWNPNPASLTWILNHKDKKCVSQAPCCLWNWGLLLDSNFFLYVSSGQWYCTDLCSTPVEVVPTMHSIYHGWVSFLGFCQQSHI